MTPPRRQWTLGAKLALTGLPFLVLGLLLTALTLWVSWQLDGGAAAVNEAGRMRMQVYRMAWLAGHDRATTLGDRQQEFDRSLALLRQGDPERPLFMPWDKDVHREFSAVEQAWAQYRRQWDQGSPSPIELDERTVALTARIDQLVATVEKHLSQWTSELHLLQLALMTLGVVGSAVLVVTGYRFVLEPVQALKNAIAQVRQGDFSARVTPTSSDEFRALAEGFNDMAERLQSLYQDLEGRVTAKTAELEHERERLEALYGVSTLITNANTLSDLAHGFTERVRAVAHADGAVLRLSEEGQQRYVMLAAQGVPASMAQDEHCIRVGDCHCGITPDQTLPRAIPIQSLDGRSRLLCERIGWATVVTVPVRIKTQLIGELDLFFHAQYQLSDAERSLLDALAAHAASGIENLRLQALEREAAVAQERGFLAQELHDSIAQSLAFLNIQVQLMRDALDSGNRERMQEALSEIDLGVRESHGDVRELLMHFRTRTNAEDIEPALRTTLRKFEHQTRIPTTLTLHGQGVPLPPDVQTQALHIVQEALSNVRKHAQASHVYLDVWRQPQWQFQVRDDGQGFEPHPTGREETHVGLRIMSERAARLGATLEVTSSRGQGTQVRLTLPSQALALNMPPTLGEDRGDEPLQVTAEGQPAPAATANPAATAWRPTTT